MSVELSLRISTPLTDEDNELLSGIAMMTMSVANQQAARFIIDNLQEKADERMEEMGARCLATDPDDEGRVCINPVGHKGRHRYRPLTEIVGLPN